MKSIAIVAVVAILFTSCSSGNTGMDTDQTADMASAEQISEEPQTVAMTNTEETAPAPAQGSGDEKQVLISTSMGDIVVKLYNETPGHRDNFLKLAEAGSLDGSIFHRVIKNFMIQGGGAPGSGGQQDVGDQIPAEIIQGLYHKKGALCAARMGDQVNPKKMSSGSQFYIVTGRVETAQQLQRYGVPYTEEQVKTYSTIGGTAFLDNNYTVFGEVVSGLDVVDAIGNVQTLPGDRPATEVTMKLSVVK